MIYSFNPAIDYIESSAMWRVLTMLEKAQQQEPYKLITSRNMFI